MVGRPSRHNLFRVFSSPDTSCYVFLFQSLAIGKVSMGNILKITDITCDSLKFNEGRKNILQSRH